MSKQWLPAVSELHESIHGLSLDEVGPGTRAVASKLHMGRDNRGAPLVQPIVHSSTYKVNSVEHYLDILKNGGYIYSRLGNPTCEAVECTINSLEGGAGSMVFATGMAAITCCTFGTLKAGDHVVACTPIYSATHNVMKNILPRFGIEVSWVTTGCDIIEYKKATKPNTKILYAETPCNPINAIIDLEAFGKLGQSLDGVITMVDSTYATPYLQQPIKYGVDIVIHSGTKYLGGHSDLVAGVVTTRTLDLWQSLNVWRCNSGGTLSPFDASLLLRGVKTLHVRMERHCSNARRLAEFLDGHSKVSVVHYPGLKSHPGHAVAKKQMKDFSGMISFEMKGGLEAAKTVVECVRLIQLAVSLGGVESLIEHPATMTHGPMIMTDEERREGLISDGLIRFSVGLEDPEDLISDLEQALEKAS